MNEELVDIVNEADELTGEVLTINQAHSKGSIHRVSAVFVFRPNGKLLVQVHKYHGRLLDHSVGGHVSAGEDYSVAAEREMREELGIDVPITQIATGVLSREHYKKTDSKISHMFAIFTAQIDEKWQFKETEEVDQIIEMTIEEIVDKAKAEPDKFLQGFLITLNAYLDYMTLIKAKSS